MKQVLEMFQIKTEGPNVNQKKELDRKKKKNQIRDVRALLDSYDRSAHSRRRQMSLMMIHFLLPNEVKTVHRIKRFHSCHKTVHLSYWQASQGGETHCLCFSNSDTDMNSLTANY